MHDRRRSRRRPTEIEDPRGDESSGRHSDVPRARRDRIGPSLGGKAAVRPGRPQVPEHIAALTGAGRRIATVRDWMEGEVRASVSPRPWIVLTFDDGDVSNHEQALPILEEAGCAATFFVTVGRIGKPGFLSWGQIRSMHRAGMEIGSHTMTHRAPMLLSDTDLRYEVAESRKRLETELGVEVVSISSPTGFFNPRIRVIAREEGYRALCFGHIAVAGPEGDPFALPRVAIKHSITSRQFERVTAPSRVHLAQLRARQMVRNGLKKLLGVDTYLRWRRRVLNLGSPR